MINDIEEVEILDVDTSGDFLDQEEAEEAVSQFPDTYKYEYNSISSLLGRIEH